MKWVLGSAHDLVAICATHGELGAVTLANAIHLVDRAQLLSDAKTGLRPGCGLAIIANSILWGSRTSAATLSG